jgi:tetratricopeptide (TPR) repeat protein
MRRRKFPRGYKAWLLVVAAAVLLCFGGLYSATLYFQVRVQGALALHDESTATRWLALARRIPLRRASSHFLEARLARRMSDRGRMQLHLQKANELGYDRESLVREEWLSRAQSGDMEVLSNQMPILLNDPRGDDVEIADAYVKGLVRNEQFTGAAQMIVAWCKDFPDDPYPLQLLGSVQLELERFEDAERSFRNVLRLQPDNYQAAYGLGNVLFTMQKTEQALAFLERAAKDDKLHVPAIVAQARCHRMLDNPQRAMQLLKKVVEASQDLTATVELAQLYLDSGDFETAAGQVEKLVKEDPNYVDARYIYAQALRQLGQLEDAEGHFLAVMEINKQLALANELAEEVKEGLGGPDKRVVIARIQLKYGSEHKGVNWLIDSFRIDNSHRPTLQALHEYYARKAAEFPADSDYGLRRDEFQQRLDSLKP